MLDDGDETQLLNDRRVNATEELERLQFFVDDLQVLIGALASSNSETIKLLCPFSLIISTKPKPPLTPYPVT